MSNEHIKRLQRIGIWLEATRGTKATVDYWIPMTDAKIIPVVEKAEDNDSFGVIDSRYGSVIAKQFNQFTWSGIARDTTFGLLLKLAMGGETLCRKIGISSITGTFQVWEVLTGWTSSATGTIKKVRDDHLVVEVTSGTFNASESVSGWTSSASATGAYDSAIAIHLFERPNTNQHNSATMYGNNPVQDTYTTFNMMDSFDINMAIGEYVRFTAAMRWKKVNDDGSPPTPSTTTENKFLATQANVYLASSYSWLDGATAESLQEMNINIAKNLTDEMVLGSDEPNAFYNQNFLVSGNVSGVFKDMTIHDLLTSGNKRYMRAELINTWVTIGSADNPTLIAEFAQASFDDFDKSSDNDGIVTLGSNFVWEYSDTDAFSFTIELWNEVTTAY